LNATDVVTAFPSASTVYKYELKGTNGYVETVNTSRDNGTTFFSQVLSLQLKKLTAEATKELKLLAYGRPKIVVADRNGNAFLVGLQYGADMTAGTITTGVAYGDLSGYTMEFTGQEQLPANFLTGSTLANPFAGVSNAPTVVYGTNS
jgi:7-cyano-7-deazaguanine synthase in queuosine biosynthesis